MRKFIIGFIILLLAVPAWAAKPQTDEQKTLYAIGVMMTKQLSIFSLSADEYEFIQQGITDVAKGQKLAVEPETYAKNISEFAKARMQAATQKQKELAKPYLENAAKEKDAQKMDSGLIYQPIKIGTGAPSKASDTVKVHYTGSLIDGKEFDSSLKRDEPAQFPLGQVIPCWTEGVAKMKVGGKAKLICPSDIAYGDQGRPPLIPGGAALVFEIELLDVIKEAPEKATTTPKPSTKPATPKAKGKK